MVTTLNILFISALVAFASISTSSNTIYEGRTIPESCRTAKPIESNYTPTGTFFDLNNMTVYETANKSATRVLIAAYDIFGLHNQTKQMIDNLAESYGFKIAMPDFFRGPAWDQSDVPPENMDDFLEWIDRVGNWDRTVKIDTLAIIDHYKTTENITQFGIFGFCWGGMVSTRAATDIPELKAAGMAHPGLVSNEDAEGVQVPMYILPASDDPGFLPFYMVLQRKFGNNCGHRRFDDMLHGFASSMGNFSDPLIRLRVMEVIDIFGTFFDRNLSN